MIYHFQKHEVSATPNLWRYSATPSLHYIDTSFTFPADHAKVVTYHVEIASRQIWNSITTSAETTWVSNASNTFEGAGAPTSAQTSSLSAKVIITSPGYTP
jgi:hypothetical protein